VPLSRAFQQLFAALRREPLIRWPWLAAYALTRPVSPGVWAVNFLVQRVLRINGNVPWMVHFTSTVVMPTPSHLVIGERVWVSFAVSGGCYVQAANGIRIGARTIFAPGVKIISANHDPRDHSKWEPGPPIVIGEDCWIGANAVILPGVQLGDRVIVGAGAVVTKSVPSDSVVAGVPARPLRERRQCA